MLTGTQTSTGERHRSNNAQKGSGVEGQHRTHLPASQRGLRGALGGRHGLGDAEIP